MASLKQSQLVVQVPDAAYAMQSVCLAVRFQPESTEGLEGRCWSQQADPQGPSGKISVLVMSELLAQPDPVTDSAKDG